MFIVVLLICGTTMLTSCTSASDNPTPAPTPDPLAKQIVGEWIVEMEVASIKPINIDQDIKFPKDANGFVLIYHFREDGYGWKEMNILKDGEPIFVPFDRYSCQFTYTVDSQGKIQVTFIDQEGQPTEESDELTFNNGVLSVENLILNRATEAQIQKYKELAESWHGGSDEKKRSVTGVSNDDWKWVDAIDANSTDR